MLRSLLSQHGIAPVVWLDMSCLAGSLCGSAAWPRLLLGFGVRTDRSASPHAGECHPLGTPPMLIAYCNDATLRLYRHVDDSVRDVEALDAEETLVQVFDDMANPYRIDWIRPNRKSRFLWIHTLANGEYTLVVSGPRRPAELLSLIRNAESFEPLASGSRLRALESSLALETGQQ